MTWSMNDRQNERWALIKRNDSNNSNLAIFVHGFRGSHLSTWGELGYYLHRKAGSEPGLSNWDYLFVGYETSSINNYLSIAELIATNWKSAAAGAPPFAPNKYQKLALIGHSLGTLGIRQFLCADMIPRRDLTGAIHSVVLLGSPLNGSPLAKFGKLALAADVATGKWESLFPKSYAIADSLKPGGAPLLMLKAWNKYVHSQNSGFKTEVWTGTDDLVVGGDYLSGWDGDDMYRCSLDHSTICKLSPSANGGTEGHMLDILRRHLT